MQANATDVLSRMNELILACSGREKIGGSIDWTYLIGGFLFVTYMLEKAIKLLSEIKQEIIKGNDQRNSVLNLKFDRVYSRMDDVVSAIDPKFDEQKRQEYQRYWDDLEKRASETANKHPTS
jgi:hypothetical protein